MADDLDARDMVCDFKALKASLRALPDAWDHAMCLNTADPQFAFLQQRYGARVVPFPDCDPTSEAMVRAIYQETAQRLRDASAYRDADFPIRTHVRVERVRVTETSSSWAEYFE